MILGASLVGFIGTRILLGGGRPEIDGMTTLGVQEWEKVLWYQIPYVLPFLAILALRFRDVHPWVRLLWIYLPVVVAAYVQQRFILHEVRSFWALAPVFTATLAGWIDAMARPAPVALVPPEPGSP